MAIRQGPERESKSKSPVGKVEPGHLASDNYKARLTKGLLGVNLGEGYIVEVLNFKTKKVLRRELFENPDEARDDLALIRDDIDRLTTDEFRKKYLKPPE